MHTLEGREMHYSPYFFPGEQRDLHRQHTRAPELGWWKVFDVSLKCERLKTLLKVLKRMETTMS